MTKPPARDDAPDAPQQKPLAETVVGVISAVVVVALVTYLAVQVLRGNDGPPDLVASVQSAERLAAKTLITVKLTNRGPGAAAAVTLRAEIQGDGGGPGDGGREISFDYVAAGSSQRGAFLFDRPDLSADDVALTIYGYIEP